MMSTQVVTSRVSHRVRGRIVQLGTIAAAVGAWLWAQGPGDVSSIILPRLNEVITEFIRFLGSSEVYRAIAVTMSEILVALAISAVLGDRDRRGDAFGY